MQKLDDFVTKRCVVFTNFIAMMGTINNLINANDISVIILMIFTIRLTKLQ